MTARELQLNSADSIYLGARSILHSQHNTIIGTQQFHIESYFSHINLIRHIISGLTLSRQQALQVIRKELSTQLYNCMLNGSTCQGPYFAAVFQSR